MNNACATENLLDLDLIAFDGRRFQVLDLPARLVPRASRSLRTREDLEDHDPLTIRGLIRDSLSNR